MSDRYKIILEGASSEIVEKKSRFIATVRAVASEAEATAFIDEMKKKYWDARHNCSAFVVGKESELQRFSDDGEPSGTAGKPMLDILKNSNIHNVCVVVTRYFGGVLLGTGGLVRAYQKATSEALSASEEATAHNGNKINILIDYNEMGKIQYIMGQLEIDQINIEYSDKVLIIAAVEMSKKDQFIKKVTEATSAQAEIEVLEEIDYVIIKKEQKNPLLKIIN